MTQSEIKKLKSVAYLSPLFGVVLGCIYIFIIKGHFGWALGFTNVITLTTVIAAFSFTMLGFLAAISAFIFSLQKYNFFKRWLEDGDSIFFFSVFRVAIICLFVTFICCLLVFTTQASDLAFKIMMISVANNGLHLIVVTMIIINNFSRVKSES